MSWIDSRVDDPTSCHFDTYFVVFHSRKGDPVTMVGFADWRPRDNYTAGDWENVRCTNGNKLGGDVLYWMKHPKEPSLKEDRK